ncbi:uncharacterized protein LOC131148123 isoform X2 [Malania oleifera]|uniref:uncharacterized protein LOC131148123 isoform X2 n=1 Tax=Malania oleifera TaxID=397392 RepID=UPI0025AE5701|nr:uncharacterized protein LOC131148123 isoform X2 [Malania oleifera]
MSDEGEKTCPLCAEEMDLTDQQLKPCKCGYEICVWCWHHIMDMAEKDETEGRCPACRVPYDKEKIVGMAANCERLVAEINMERKLKSQKSKTKSSEGRKQLSSVRVIQRNLVYIVGLPLNLADEDLLQRREYFGQYGKVLKVSISRTAAGTIQHFPNSTCSVYITFSKEDEAVRCIQTVHGFVLDGRSLRACFGTTKYCHAWLRNVPCSNPDCLYLHEIGSQEDSFTKDEIISAYTRVQQITGGANNLQRRSGNVLPPAADEYLNNSSTSAGKAIVKNASNNLAGVVRGSPPNGSSGRSITLPAAASWGMRASNCHPPAAASLTCSNGSSKEKPDTLSGSLPFSSAIASTTLTSKVHSETGKKPSSNEESQQAQSKGRLEILDSVKPYGSSDCPATESETTFTSGGASATVTVTDQLSCPPASGDSDSGTGSLPNVSSSLDLSSQSCSPEKGMGVATDGKIQSISSIMSSVSIDERLGNEHSGVIKPNFQFSDHVPMKLPMVGNLDLPQCYAEQLREPLASPAARKTATPINCAAVPREQSDLRSDSPSQGVQGALHDAEDNLLFFDNQRLNSEVINHTTLPSSSHFLNHSRSSSVRSSEAYCLDSNSQIVYKKASEGLSPDYPQSSSVSVLSNGYPENPSGLNRTVGHPYVLLKEGKPEQMGRLGCEGANISSTAVDMGESSIISNILSMEFDALDDSLTSPQNLAKMLGEREIQHGSLKLSNSWKVQNNNQSRFSFAREGESKNKVFDVEPSFDNFGVAVVPKNHSFSQNFVEDRDPHLDRLGNGNVFPSSYVEESDSFVSGHSFLPSSKLSVSRAQVSAPPGFSVPSRAPPPGFLSHERMDQTFDTATGNRLLDTSSLLRNPYQALETVNMGNTGDIEFIDPAILAVGKGRLPGGLNNPGLDMRSNVPSQYNAFENEARLQLLMQRSLSQHQNIRFPDVGDKYSPLSDSYGIPSRLMEQSQTNNVSPFAQMSLQQSRNALMSNGHWDGWNEVQSGNNLGMAELLRNERLGFNKFYGGYEESKFRMPNSGDLYNRTFGM